MTDGEPAEDGEEEASTLQDELETDDSQTLRTQAGPGSETWLFRWVLLDGNRWVVALLLALGMYAALFSFGVLEPTPLSKAMERGYPVETGFSALATAIVTGVTLIVTIDQLVLTQQLGPLSEQRDRLESAIEFRQEVEAVLGDASPAEPAALLAALIETNEQHADDLLAAESDAEEEIVEEVHRFVGDHRVEAKAIGERLEGARYLRFGALRAVLDYRYAWRVHEALRLRRQYGEDLSTAGQEALDGIIRTLRLFGPAREHVRGLYFQSELVTLSRVILIVAGPALVSSLAMVFFLDNGDVTGATLGIENLVWVVTLAATVGALPFLLLVSYVLRIVTITQRTLSSGPFLLNEADQPTHE